MWDSHNVAESSQMPRVVYISAEKEKLSERHESERPYQSQRLMCTCFVAEQNLKQHIYQFTLIKLTLIKLQLM